MSQPKPRSLGIALLESPQLREEQFLLLNTGKAIEPHYLSLAHRVVHKAAAKLDYRLHINSHRSIAHRTRHKHSAVRHVEVEFGMTAQHWLAVLTCGVYHVALAQSVFHEHVVEQQACSGAQPLATIKAVTHHLFAAVAR